MVLTVLSLLCLPIGCAAQKSVSELPPAHASALQQFLSAHPGLEFLSERSYDQEYLKWMRESFGTRFTPFYQKGDFNRDGRQDFAMVLAKDTPPKEDLDLGESHRFRYDVTVVIFNGLNGGAYKAAFVKNITAPLVCFINISQEKKKRLYFGVYETHEGFIMTSAGKGYIAEDLP
jgi:hypothetical protein